VTYKKTGEKRKRVQDIVKLNQHTRTSTRTQKINR
jgi:hypothetical protein